MVKFQAVKHSKVRQAFERYISNISNIMKQIVKLSLLALMFLAGGCSENVVPESQHHKNDFHVTIDEAREDLLNLMADLEDPHSRGDKSASKEIVSEYTFSSEGKTRSADGIDSSIYVYNFANDGGYAIMSSDERMPSLIAYSESGNITPETEIDNPGVMMFLANIESRISKNDMWIADQPVVIDPESDYVVYGEWRNTVYIPNGLCKVKWDQGHPHNMYCPVENGKRTLTGCVATAVAQLMSVHECPANYNGYSFAWPEMKMNPKASDCSDVGRDNIARCMQQLGLKENLDMNYGLNGSSAKMNNVIRTLRSFGYTNPGTLGDYCTSDVVTELKNRYPVLVAGASKKIVKKILGITVSIEYEGAHCWLLHGLLERSRDVITYYPGGGVKHKRVENVWYPLCNWGWNGSRDGYYLSYGFDVTTPPAFPVEEESDETENQQQTRSDKNGNYQYKLTQITGIRK